MHALIKQPDTAPAVTIQIVFSFISPFLPTFLREGGEKSVFKWNFEQEKLFSKSSTLINTNVSKKNIQLSVFFSLFL